jgi:hypothetical protein
MLMTAIVSIDKDFLIQDSIQVLGLPGWPLSDAPRWLLRTIFPARRQYDRHHQEFIAGR